MQDEIHALNCNRTWTYASLPLGKEAIKCKYAYYIKYKANGTMERYKARLVVKGYSQVEGEDFTDTFAQVAKTTPARYLLTLATRKGNFLHQMDMNNAFLHGDLTKEMYIELTPGVNPPWPGQYCRLQKSLYGLR